jgi:hypothetical protein
MEQNLFVKNVFTLIWPPGNIQTDNTYIKEEKKINLVLSLMGFRKQFNLYLVSRANKLVDQDLFARNAIL